MDAIKHKNNVEYYLSSSSQERTRIPEPVNYLKGNRNKYKRDDKSKGFLTVRTNDLQFTGEGSEFLIKQFYTRGAAEDVLLEKEIKSENRVDEAWRSTVPVYMSILDLEFEEKFGAPPVAKSKAVEGGLKALIDKRSSDVIDITNTTDYLGNEIPELETETISLPSREIFLRSVLNVDEDVEIGAIVSGGDRLNARCFPFQVETNSDRQNIDYVLGDKLSAANNNYANLSNDKIGNCFITSADTEKRIKINGKVKATIITANAPTGPNHMDIVIYSGGDDFVFSRAIRLVDFNPANNGEIIEFDFNDYPLEIAQGESVTIGLLSDTQDGIRYRVNETEIVITEDSVFPESISKAITYKQALNRLIYIITGVNNLVFSELLETGELSEDLIVNGYWVRGFPNVVNEGSDEERKIPFNVSVKQVLDHIEALSTKAWWVEKRDQKEVFRVELYSYTQQNFDIVFGETLENGTPVYTPVSQIKRKAIKKNFYSTIETGSEKGGDDYEEVIGLRSICGKATYSTINRNNDEVYSKLSPFRLSDIDIEIPRRLPYSLYPEEDTRYDSDVMCIRSKKVNGSYFVKGWQDIFESAPKGIYRPDSAYNLDLSPAQLLLKHGANISSAVYHYPEDSIIFLSSNCNSAYTTKKSGEEILVENNKIAHTKLKRATVKPSSVSLIGSLSQELEDKITSLNNSGVPNWFGRLAVDTGEQIEYFRIQEIDPNDEGKHKFIEAY